MTKLIGKRADFIIYDEIGESRMATEDIVNWEVNKEWFPVTKKADKFAPVVPYHFYQQFLMHDYVPSSVLLLAHDVVAHPVEYSELFKDSRWNNTTIFMDNSLVELKQAVDIEMVAEAVGIIDRPQIVVICPDVMAEAEESAKLTLDAWPEWSWRFREHQKLVVIQGSTMEGFLGCAEALEELNPDWVSIPRVTEGLFGYHRSQLIPYIGTIFPTSKLHLLGFSDYIWEDLYAASYPSVQSIDSAVPFRMSTNNVLSEQIPPRGNWWEKAKFDKSCLDRVRKINQLISRFA